MRYEPIDQKLFVENRERLRATLKPNSLVIVHSNDIMPTNADGVMGFLQNTDLFHLSGIDQEESVLMLYPDHPDEKMRELVFVRETSEQISIWEGDKLTKGQATEVSGVDEVHWTDKYPELLPGLMFQADHVYLNSNEHGRNISPVPSREQRLNRELIEAYPLHDYIRLAPIMHDLRCIKSQIEIDLLQRACSITHDGFLRLLKFVKPGVHEYEVEAELLHEFMGQRSKGFAYPPIIASGKNNCVLHYVENDRLCNDGDLLLLDVAAEYANYNADMTRTIPVNGRYTDRQKQIYNIVLKVFRQCCEWLQPGVIIKEYQKQVEAMMEEELIAVGLLDAKEVKEQDKDKPLYKKYFMHGVSHHLGLDVHDVSNLWRPIEEGMVFTVEPGLYIRDEGFGVRLENDIVIRKGGNLDLMGHIPIEAEEIEELMNAS